MKVIWEQLYEMSSDIPIKEFENWVKEFTEKLGILLNQLLLVADSELSARIMIVLKDITEGIKNQDVILLKDAIRYGLLEMVKDYCE